MAVAAVKMAAVTAIMAANGVPPTDLKAKAFYESIYDMIILAFGAAVVMPTALIAPGGLSPAPVTGTGTIT